MVVGGTDLYVHKYISTANNSSNDFTQPQYANQSATNIQDLLFLENRDRVYDTDIIRLRGHYQVQSHDFDLSQFGLFLNNDIIFIVVHFNTMIDLVGRKLMVGDVIELPHLLDEYPLDTTLKYSLKRYYQVTDANWASEGYSLTWFGHLWRIKCEPLTDSQEFSQILDEPDNKDNYLGTWNNSTVYPPGYVITYAGSNYKAITEVPMNVAPPNTTYWEVDEQGSIRDIVSRYAENINANDAVLKEAQRLVPLSGYSVNNLYVVPYYDEFGTPGNKANISNNLIRHPAPPKDVQIRIGVPILNGTLAYMHNPNYRNSSPVLRIAKNDFESLLNSTTDSDISLDKFIQMSLQAESIDNPMIGSGSGSVEVEYALIATSGGNITGPYGTSDNTYSTGDQAVSVILTAGTTPAQSFVVNTMSDLKDVTIHMLIRGISVSANGSKSLIWPNGTRIQSVDVANKKITTTNKTLSSIPPGATLQVAYDFSGVVTPEMDYRADCDPRFAYISRRSPRSFGYLAGYLTGDGNAPNGLPTGSGIAFPSNPKVGDYFLRIDYLPQVLFRWDGKLWVRISENVRTPLYLQDGDQSQRASFINNSNVTILTDGTTTTQKQSLSEVLRQPYGNIPPIENDPLNN